jgi:uncharacterized protein
VTAPLAEADGDHAMLLYVGDILAAHGVLLALGAWAGWWRDRSLLVWAAFFFELPPDPWTAIAERLPVQPVIMLLGPSGFACPLLLGLWAGRRRILERPEAHRRMLAVVAVAGIAASVLGAQPLSLLLCGATSLRGADAFGQANALHDATGVLGGAGYAAALALLLLRLSGSRSGSRSLGRGARRHRPALAHVLPRPVGHVGRRLHAVPARPRR